MRRAAIISPLRTAVGRFGAAQGKRVAFDGPARTVIDGPFSEARQLVAGFWLWEVKDMDEAITWVKRCPNPMPGPSEIEIRPLYEMADLRPWQFRLVASQHLLSAKSGSWRAIL